MKCGLFRGIFFLPFHLFRWLLVFLLQAGMIRTDSDEYFIEPLERGTQDLEDGGRVHVVYRRSALLRGPSDISVDYQAQGRIHPGGSGGLKDVCTLSFDKLHPFTLVEGSRVVKAAAVFLCCWGKVFDSYFPFCSKMLKAARDNQICLLRLCWTSENRLLCSLGVVKLDSLPVCTSTDRKADGTARCTHRSALIGETDGKPQQNLQKSRVHRDCCIDYS